MSMLLCVCALLLLSYTTPVAEGGLVKGFRPPAVPLITYDPYLSIWSPATKLTDSWSTLWDGTIKAFMGIIRIDGTAFRFMGPDGGSGGANANPMSQTSVQVFPTRTVYVFQQNGIQLTLTFTTPLLPTSTELLSRPVTYLTYDVVSTDGKSHSVQLYYDNTAEIAVDNVSENVRWGRSSTPNGLQAMRVGTDAQNVLGKAGDGVGINWGYFYVATATGNGVQQSMANAADLRSGFIQNGRLPGDNNNMPTPASQGWISLGVMWDLGSVGTQSVQRLLLVAYDDISSINYFGTRMNAYWKNLYSDIYKMLDQSFKDYSSLAQQAAAFDNNLITQLTNAGGEEYATIASLAYRQTLAGTKMTWSAKYNTAWYFMKEISSDGDISTVDVIFPACPLFLYFNPNLLVQQLLPIMDYANNGTSNKYNLVWAPHHLGTWPIANIQSNQQENMPIEETANMLLMISAAAKRGADITPITGKYWNILLQWADYLVSALPDPEDQLCTDDFEGPIPHDSNLALKGILGLGAFAQLCQLNKNSTCQQHYNSIAQDYANKWQSMSNPQNTDHYRLRYDQDGWSLKYNILFQNMLGLDLFPAIVMQRELAYYMKHLNAYGVPLDNRNDFTKLDWESWVAAVSPDQNIFTSIIHAIYQFAHTTPDRVALSDWYFTSSAKKTGFQARTVVGGVYAKMIVPK